MAGQEGYTVVLPAPYAEVSPELPIESWKSAVAKDRLVPLNACDLVISIAIREIQPGMTDADIRIIQEARALAGVEQGDHR